MEARQKPGIRGSEILTNSVELHALKLSYHVCHAGGKISSVGRSDISLEGIHKCC